MHIRTNDLTMPTRAIRPSDIRLPATRSTPLRDRAAAALRHSEPADPIAAFTRAELRRIVMDLMG